MYVCFRKFHGVSSRMRSMVPALVQAAGPTEMRALWVHVEGPGPSQQPRPIFLLVTRRSSDNSTAKGHGDGRKKKRKQVGSYGGCCASVPGWRQLHAEGNKGVKKPLMVAAHHFGCGRIHLLPST
ncbi:hypothetical protein MUK42_35143 [Musa troglodytarum]|uniref:Uncharacterized protein n=1 Tax=Musa troglodytarum TaxID=320322 RepID=A0A9E7KEI9_9LILI|nr:hypothetical protein MUK42_35143 [Musa troglodytarum]